MRSKPKTLVKKNWQKIEALIERFFWVATSCWAANTSFLKDLMSTAGVSFLGLHGTIDDQQNQWTKTKGHLHLLMDDIRRSPVEVGSLSHYLRGFIHLRWLFGISEPSRGCLKSGDHQLICGIYHYLPWYTKRVLAPSQVRFSPDFWTRILQQTGSLPPAEKKWTNVPKKKTHFKTKMSFSNHQFSGDMLVFTGGIQVYIFIL